MISDYYKDQNRRLHEIEPSYGVRSHRWLEIINKLMSEFGAKSVLDYGCGKGKLSDFIEVTNYDPAVPEFDITPTPHDIVVCTDVLEHIEPRYLDSVSEHLHELTNKVVLINIATRYDRSKLMPDGTNPHKLVKSKSFWKRKLKEHFNIHRKISSNNTELSLVCTPARKK